MLRADIMTNFERYNKVMKIIKMTVIIISLLLAILSLYEVFNKKLTGGYNLSFLSLAIVLIYSLSQYKRIILATISINTFNIFFILFIEAINNRIINEYNNLNYHFFVLATSIIFFMLKHYSQKESSNNSVH